MLRELFESAQRPGAQVFGRVCSTHPSMELTHLAHGRKVVFCFSHDVLEATDDLSPYEILLYLGLRPDYLAREIAQGSSYVACVFSDEPVPPATWDGVLILLERHFPLAFGDYERHLPALRALTSEAAEAMPEFHAYMREVWEAAGRDPPAPVPRLSHLVCDVDKASSPGYMSYEAFVRLPEPRSLLQTRLFLYCELRLLEMFTGDGFTETGDGDRGVAEYLCLNRPLDPAHVLVREFPVRLSPDDDSERIN